MGNAVKMTQKKARVQEGVLERAKRGAVRMLTNLRANGREARAAIGSPGTPRTGFLARVSGRSDMVRRRDETTRIMDEAPYEAGILRRRP